MLFSVVLILEFVDEVLNTIRYEQNFLVMLFIMFFSVVLILEFV